MSGKSTSSRIRHRLTLQQEIQTPDGAGGYTRSWQNVADVWAEISAFHSSTSAMGKEVLFGGQLESHVTHRITLRYFDGVSAGMRLVFEDRIFNIRYVSDTGEMRESLSILAEEGVAT